MKLKRVFINNYREFRSTFHEDVDAYYVMGNLQKDVAADLEQDENAHVQMSYAPSYDDDGFALFDVVQVKVSYNQVEVRVVYTGTAK